MKTKIFVLDTNVLITDPAAFLAYSKGDTVVIPYKVIEELEKHKLDQGDLGMAVKRCSRMLMSVIGDTNEKTLKTGIKLDNGSILKAIPARDLKHIETVGPLKSGDDHILAVCVGLNTLNKTSVTLVSNDMLLKIRANSFDIPCKGHLTSSSIKSLDDLYSGHQEIDVDDEIASRYWEEHMNEEFFSASEKELGLKEKLSPNEFVVLNQEGLKPSRPWSVVRSQGKKLKFVHEKKLDKLKPLNIEQYLALDLLMDPKVQLVSLMGQAGTGKAQPLTSKVLTPTGWKKMSSIKKGSFVVGQDGKPAKVSGVFPQGKKDIYKVKFNDGSVAECCKEHLWYTETRLDRNAKRKGTVKSLEEISSSLKYGKHHNHFIPMVDIVEFEPQKITLDPYVLGVLLGDGSMSLPSAVHLTTADPEIAAKCQHRLKDKNIRIKQKNHSKIEYGIVHEKHQYKNNYVLKCIKELKLHGKRSHEKFVPKNYLFNTKKVRLSVLQGLMDTDGYISKSGHGVIFYSTSRQLAKDIQFLAQSFGGKAQIKNKQTFYTYKDVKKKGKKSYAVYLSLPQDVYPVSIVRKLSRFKPRTKYLPIRAIDSIEHIGKKEAQCIMVENKNHLYVTNDFVITHNTILSIEAGLNQVMGQKRYKTLLILRPVHSVGKDIGYLPGTKDEKLEPWLAPIKDNLRFLLSDQGNKSKDNGRRGESKLDYLFDQGIIEMEAMSFIRGRSINDAFILVDEAQNINQHELKTILTRVGKGTKVVLTGDVEQTDRNDVGALTNGLAVSIEKFRKHGIAGHVTLREGVRSELSALAAKIL